MVMATFVLLFNGGGMPETEAEQGAVLQAWGVWYESLGAAVVDGGKPFTPVAKHISSDGALHDGPAGTLASGYTIIKADSLDAAAELGKSCPILAAGGQITVYEGIDMAM
jgi:hypothetical protein